MNPRVQKVECKNNHVLLITFKDGQVKFFDMLPYLSYPVFEALKDDSFFKKAHVLHGTVAWNEELDIDPDTLYLEGIDKSEFAI